MRTDHVERVRHPWCAQVSGSEMDPPGRECVKKEICDAEADLGASSERLSTSQAGVMNSRWRGSKRDAVAVDDH